MREQKILDEHKASEPWSWQGIHANQFVFMGLIALMLYPAFYLLSGNWGEAGLVVGLIVAFCLEHSAKAQTALRKRISAEQDSEWMIVINDVPVGTIQDTHYAKIRLNVFMDSRVYLLQALNIMRVFLGRIVFSLYINIPAIVFWVFIALYIADSNNLNKILELFQKVSSKDILQYLEFFSLMLYCFLLISIGFYRMIGIEKFGLKNCFSEEIDKRVRKYCNVVADGKIHLQNVD